MPLSWISNKESTACWISILKFYTAIIGSVKYFEHEQLDTLVEELKSKGSEFTQEPTDKDYLWREAMLADPSGNGIKRYWTGENRLNPPWRINA